MTRSARTRHENKPDGKLLRSPGTVLQTSARVRRQHAPTSIWSPEEIASFLSGFDLIIQEDGSQSFWASRSTCMVSEEITLVISGSGLINQEANSKSVKCQVGVRFFSFFFPRPYGRTAVLRIFIRSRLPNYFPKASQFRQHSASAKAKIGQRLSRFCWQPN